MNKTIIATEDAITFTYRISSLPEDVTQLELIEQFPESVTASAIKFSNHDDGVWECHTPNEIAFSIEHPQTEPIETTVQVASTTLDPNECVSEIRTSREWPAPRSVSHQNT